MRQKLRGYFRYRPKATYGVAALLFIALSTANTLSLVLPLKASAAGELNFTELATHPQAAAQPNNIGKTLNTLQIFNGKIYAGYGDYNANTGPIDINPFDIADSSFDGVAVEVPTESLGNWQIINNKLYTTTIDATCSGSCPSGYAVGDSSHSWEVKTPVAAEHMYAVSTLTGSDIWLFGSTGGAQATAWRSTDNGNSWQIVQTHENEPGGDNSERYYWGQALNGKMYMQANIPGYNNPVQVFDGTNWSTGTDTEVCGTGTAARGPNPVVFDNKIICSHNTQLSVFDGTSVTDINYNNSNYPSDCGTTESSIVSAGDTLYALCRHWNGSGYDAASLVRTKDLNGFIEYTGITNKAASMAIDRTANKIYIGTTDSKILVSDLPAPDSVPPSVTLTSPTNGQNLTKTYITLQATASDSDSGMSKVEFYLGDDLIATDREAPYQTGWQNDFINGSWTYPDGNYSFKAVAYDIEGNQQESQTSTVHISHGNNLTIEEYPTELANTALAVDDEDNVWFLDADFSTGMTSGINKLNTESGAIEERPVPDGESFNASYGAPMFYRQGKLWIIDCQVGVQSYDVVTEEINTYAFDQVCMDGEGALAVTPDGVAYNAAFGQDSINIVDQDGSPRTVDFNDTYSILGITIDKSGRVVFNYAPEDMSASGIATLDQNDGLDVIYSEPLEDTNSALLGYSITSQQNGTTILGGYPDFSSTDMPLLTRITSGNSVSRVEKSVPATAWRLKSGSDNRTWFVQGNGIVGMLEDSTTSPELFGGILTRFAYGAYGMPDSQVDNLNEFALGYQFSGSLDVDTQNNAWVSDSIGGRILKLSYSNHSSGDPDSDGDSIPDSAESGDKNNDGIADSTQANVAVVPNVVTGETTVLALDNNCAIQSVETKAESSLSSSDAGFNYPNGLVSFTADCGSPGASTNVKLYYYDVSGDFTLRKFNSTFMTIPNASISQQTIAGHTVTVASYSVTDGQEFDADNQANGTIVDPVGLGISAVGAPNTGIRPAWLK